MFNIVSKGFTTSKYIYLRSFSITSNELRNKYLHYFEQNGHKIVQGSSLIPNNDESLLFVNAGMVQFKQVFLGTETRPYKRATTSQLCVRAGGKHNDLENVGFTPRHQTLFEMLGNFSLGDYFKEEAIFYAWNFLTKELNLSKDHLRVSVYKEDMEAKKLWQKISGLDDKFIFLRDKKDNFWSMSDTIGPCGPCTEIFYTNDINCFNYDDLLEIWNCVFMQYNQNNGELIPLTNRYVDTGMGHERMLSVLQHVSSNFDTDVFSTIKENIYSNIAPFLDINHIPNIQFPPVTSKSPFPREYVPLLNILSDHLRTISILIYQGIYPSATSRGYVLRKLIRRCLKYSYMYNIHDSFLSECIPCVLQELTTFCPNIYESLDSICRIINNEEYYYLRAVSTGKEQLDLFMNSYKKTQSKSPVSFKYLNDLYSSTGIPVDVSEYILSSNCIPIDKESIMKGMEQINTDIHEIKHKSKRNVNNSNIDSYVYGAINQDIKKQLLNTFDGYTIHYSQSNISKDSQHLMTNTLSSQLSSLKNSTQYTLKALFIPPIQSDPKTKNNQCCNSYLCIDPCPFYPCSGGQCGDTGYIIVNGHKINIQDTVRLNDQCILLKTNTPLNQFSIAVNNCNNQIECFVDISKRKQTSIHHTSTHILHSYLRQYIDDYHHHDTHPFTQMNTDLPPIQAGSSVDSHCLRFDYVNKYNLDSKTMSHILQSIESDVNKRVQQSCPVQYSYMNYTDSIKDGYTGMFVDNYKETVRGVTIDNISKELCGGTHAENIEDIYPLVILKNSSISAGVKRVEAVAGKSAVDYLYKQFNIMRDITNSTDIPMKDIKQTLITQKSQIKDLNTENKQLYKYIYATQKPTYTTNYKGHSMNVFTISEDFSNAFLSNFPTYISSNTLYPDINIFVKDKTIICQNNLPETERSTIDCKLLLKSLFKLLPGGGNGGGKSTLAQGQAKENVTEIIKNAIESLSP